MLDWDLIFAQLKRFYRCSKAEFKVMTLYEVFQLLEDGEKMVKAEGGSKSSKGKTGTAELAKMAQRRGIRLPSKGL